MNIEDPCPAEERALFAKCANTCAHEEHQQVRPSSPSKHVYVAAWFLNSRASGALALLRSRVALAARAYYAVAHYELAKPVEMPCLHCNTQHTMSVRSGAGR